jgi:hypothetical protein
MSSSKAHRALDPGVLEWCRRRVERAWSEETAHRTVRPLKPEDVASRGQCGVTSRWLKDVFRKDYDLDTTYCIGELHAGDALSVDYHCWLEVGDAGSPEAVVVDLTADQAPEIDDEVVAGRRQDLEGRGISYVIRRKPSDDELDLTSVRERLDRLAEALNDACTPDRSKGSRRVLV